MFITIFFVLLLMKSYTDFTTSTHAKKHTEFVSIIMFELIVVNVLLLYSNFFFSLRVEYEITIIYYTSAQTSYTIYICTYIYRYNHFNYFIDLFSDWFEGFRNENKREREREKNKTKTYYYYCIVSSRIRTYTSYEQLDLTARTQKSSWNAKVNIFFSYSPWFDICV